MWCVVEFVRTDHIVSLSVGANEAAGAGHAHVEYGEGHDAVQEVQRCVGLHREDRAEERVSRTVSRNLRKLHEGDSCN